VKKVERKARNLNERVGEIRLSVEVWARQPKDSTGSFTKFAARLKRANAPLEVSTTRLEVLTGG
jgi:hypothetical protein